MLIFSASPCVFESFSRTRVFHPFTSKRISQISCTFSVRSSGRDCPCVIDGVKSRAVEELVEDKELTVEMMRAPVLAFGSESENSRTFLDVRSEEELLYGVRKEMEAGRLPSNVAVRMEEIYHNYSNAVRQSENPKASEIILSNMAVAFDRILLDVEDHFTFKPYHKAIREPVDYNMFGQNYLRPLIDFRRLSDHSGVLGHIYPLALLCYDVMPPPPQKGFIFMGAQTFQIEKQIGERRLISYHGVGLSVAPKMCYNEIVADIENPAEAKAAFSQALYASVTEQYNVLKSAIYGNQGLDASNSILALSQPWK